MNKKMYVLETLVGIAARAAEAAADSVLGEVQDGLRKADKHVSRAPRRVRDVNADVIEMRPKKGA